MLYDIDSLLKEIDFENVKNAKLIKIDNDKSATLEIREKESKIFYYDRYLLNAIVFTDIFDVNFEYVITLRDALYEIFNEERLIRLSKILNSYNYYCLDALSLIIEAHLQYKKDKYFNFKTYEDRLHKILQLSNK